MQENLHSYVTVEFNVRFSTFPPNLVRIGPIVKKWQPIFEIQDGGGGHLEFEKIKVFIQQLSSTSDFQHFRQLW